MNTHVKEYLFDTSIQYRIHQFPKRADSNFAVGVIPDSDSIQNVK